MTININQPCLCLRDKKFHFVKGKIYFVEYLYQMPDGELMVVAINDKESSVGHLAKCFKFPTSSATLTVLVN